MAKITSLDDLRKIRQRVETDMNIREKSNSPETLTQIKVAMATCGIAAGARPVMNKFIELVEKDKLAAIVTQTGCIGYCHAEPTVVITRPGTEPVVFGHVNEAKVVEIIEKYVKNGELMDGILPINYQSIQDKE